MAKGGGKKKPAKVVLSDKDWEAIKAEYESGPEGTSLRSLARPGASHQTIARRAREGNWKRIDPASPAIRKAVDKAADAKSADIPAPEVEVVADEPRTNTSLTVISPLGEAAAIEARASVLSRHRLEWGAVRNRVYAGLQQNKFDKLKEGKIAAEALSIIQAGERKAWGLDKPLSMTFTFVAESGRDIYD